MNGTVHPSYGRPTAALCHLRQEGFFVAESSPGTAREASQTRGRQVLDREQMRRALIRIAHEILEGNMREPDIVIVGIHSGGVHLAERTANLIEEFEGKRPPVGQLDIGLYRDDLRRRGRPVMRPTSIPVPIEGRPVVLIDDVLYTGRTVRAAMDALNDFGRPSRVQLAVLIDRGHRELPIRADYVGRNIPTSLDEEVRVHLSETGGDDEVVLLRRRS